MKFILQPFFLIAGLLAATHSLAWGPEGHAIVGRLAMKLVQPDVRENVNRILNGMPLDTAANWMDIMKSNQDYEFMRPWHYVDFPEGENYDATNTENLISRLKLTYNELKHKNTLCEVDVKNNMLILFHLVGDLSMPLHTGYEEDLGGNKRIVQYDTIKTHNLHRFWDEDIIALSHITDSMCLLHFNKELADTLMVVDFENWMKDSRSLLNNVYDFPGFKLDSMYMAKNKTLVEKQLLKAGLRLALILNRLFSSPAPMLNFTEMVKGKNVIEAKDAINHIGKKVIVYARVYGVKLTPKVAQLSLGAKYPENILTAVVFAKSFADFKMPLDELFKDRNIAVKGEVKEYNGKAEIIIEDVRDIELLE